jgi:hypothetical protein
MMTVVLRCVFGDAEPRWYLGCFVTRWERESVPGLIVLLGCACGGGPATARGSLASSEIPFRAERNLFLQSRAELLCSGIV